MADGAGPPASLTVALRSLAEVQGRIAFKLRIAEEILAMTLAVLEVSGAAWDELDLPSVERRILEGMRRDFLVAAQHLARQRPTLAAMGECLAALDPVREALARVPAVGALMQAGEAAVAPALQSARETEVLVDRLCTDAAVIVAREFRGLSATVPPAILNTLAIRLKDYGAFFKEG